MTNEQLFKLTTNILKQIDLFKPPFCADRAEEYAKSILNASSARCDVFCGATKLVIDFWDSDKVVKIPFRHNHETQIELTGANNTLNGWDYCLTEEEIWYSALQHGVELFFAPTIEIGKYGEIPLYVQPKCISLTQKDKTSIDWTFDTQNIYGKDLYKSFCIFIEDYLISDLTEGNVGYTLEDNMPVVFDYSSYDS